MGDHQSRDHSFNLINSIYGAQMLFVASGTLVLIPLFTHFDLNVTLFTAGLGTLIFQAMTHGQIPVFLAPSIIYIAPIIYSVKTWGIPGTLCGLAVAGCLYIIVSAIIQIHSAQIIERLFPPLVTGPMIMILGLSQVPMAGHLVMGKSFDGITQLIPQYSAVTIAIVTLSVTVLVSILGNGICRMIPILCGIAAGYLFSLCLGIVNFSPLYQAQWIAIPKFVMPQWHFDAICYMLPAAFISIMTHLGDILAIGSITNNNYLKSPGIHWTLMGNGIATGVALMLGGPPNAPDSGVSGAAAFTRQYQLSIMTWAAIISILLSFVGKLGALFQTIPPPVMGGIMLILFGAITVVGLKQLAHLGDDLTSPRNMAIIALMMTIGLGGMSSKVTGLDGLSLAGILGIFLNCFLPVSQEKYGVGILVYGSMMTDPGKEIIANTLTSIPAITPFNVEYARKSKNRSNAPVLVPVSQGGTKVRAKILVMKSHVSEELACDFLYRRAINFVEETAIMYADKDNHKNSGLEIQYLKDFENVAKVFYTAFTPNIENIVNPTISPDDKSKDLAYLAIDSLNQDTFCMQRDGIRCLIDDIHAGIKTPLSDFYVKEIINRASSANDLNEARINIARQKHIYP
ncbi:MAG: Uracil permease [Candidatus Magnetoglobus multicellularis str. Araruama]|uniref:Uracil permease n=1 Tax=Candidatus Magnetoglobus multicellularis str. Araruama TaxID=890399 RepID=A0A1V1PE18_9BACT|nr:MAG: Uracil permease [Candidatus Magnetoglobus multicellularis str. Araruama]